MQPYFTVGPLCVEFYYDPSPPSPVAFNFTQKGTMTRFARDFYLETCLQPFTDDHRHVFIKVYNDKPAPSLPRMVQIQVVGYNIKCDPIRGLKILLMPSCNNPGNCPNLVICTNVAVTYFGGLPRCMSRCRLDYADWDYVVLNIIKVADASFSYTTWKICEISVIGWILIKCAREVIGRYRLVLIKKRYLLST